jgi:hypothetical protein
MSDAIRVNQNVLSWGSITAKLGGVRYTFFRTVSYGDKRERTFQYGAGVDHSPRGRTRGKYSTEEGKLGGAKAGVRQFLLDLATKASDGETYGDVEFDVIVEFFENDELPCTDKLYRCVVTGVNSSHEEGPDGLEDELTLSYFEVTRNGKRLAKRRQ